MRKSLLIISLASALLLAGCTGTSDTDSGGSQTKTYDVPVEAAHNVNGADRTISLKVTQDGKELGSGTYSTAGKPKSEGTSPNDFQTVFTVKANAGAVKIQAFEGNNPLNFKSIDPAKCSDPNFQVHVVDGAVHLWSNCD